jgi:hypothetical protein
MLNISSDNSKTSMQAVPINDVEQVLALVWVALVPVEQVLALVRVALVPVEQVLALVHTPDM